jgi:predicted GNAT superfamily acetyltransferase
MVVIIMELVIGSADEADFPALQQLNEANLFQNLSLEEAREFGFLSDPMPYEYQRQLNKREPFITAKLDGRLIGYLVPLPDYYRDMPELMDGWDQDEVFIYEGRRVGDYQFIRLGQVVVDKEFRGRGVLRALYEEMKRRYLATYELVLVWISKYNSRSLLAHQKLGFLHLGEYSGKCRKDTHERCRSRLAESSSTNESCTSTYSIFHHAWRRAE